MTINLHTGTDYAPRPEDMITKKGGCGYKPDMPTPLWDAFLDRVTGGDTALVSYLQRVCGYCLTGHTWEHALFFLYGTGANGKSVLVNTIAGIMGDYAITAPMDLFMATRNEAHPTGLAMLRGARLVVATETEGGARWSEAKIKQLTGGDKIAARFMRGDFFEYTPQFKLMIAGNHVPALRHVDEAMRRRIHLIPFTVTIPPDERDDRLADKMKTEWPGILAWMVEGALEWREHGLRPPEAVTGATAAYLESEDSFATWMDECCERSEWAHETTTHLYDSFKRWMEKAGEIAPSMKRFATTMQERGLKPKRDGTGRRGFIGLRLRTPTYDDNRRMI